jgi:hypothetical protein
MTSPGDISLVTFLGPWVSRLTPPRADPLDDRLIGREERVITPGAGRRASRCVPPLAPDLSLEHFGDVSTPATWTCELIDRVDEVLRQ